MFKAGLLQRVCLTEDVSQNHALVKTQAIRRQMNRRHSPVLQLQQRVRSPWVLPVEPLHVGHAAVHVEQVPQAQVPPDLVVIIPAKRIVVNIGNERRVWVQSRHGICESLV